MKTLALGALAALALSSSGCVLVGPGHPTRAPAAVRSDRGGGKACPPGHVWGDGECHSRGKGHDKHRD